MIIRDDGVWVRTKENDVYFNLNYVDYVDAYLEMDEDVFLCIDNTLYTVDNETQAGNTKSDAAIIADYVYEEDAKIISIANCLWIANYQMCLINLNRVEAVWFDSDGDTKPYIYDIENDCRPDSPVLKISGKLWSLGEASEAVFRDFFGLPKEGVPSDFVWPPPWVKKISINEVEKCKWQRKEVY